MYRQAWKAALVTLIVLGGHTLVKAQDLPKKIAVALGGGVKLEMVLIPAGKFTMGSPAKEEDRSNDEGPQHEVEITRPFYLGIYPVTQGQWKQVMGNNPSWFSANGKGKGEVVGLDTSDFPVETVSWNDAVAFCKKVSELPEEKRAGRVYRLPTEAEWEYSCRGGAKSYQVFSFGNSLSSTQANFNGNFPYGGAAKGPYLGRTCKVGSYKPNGFGLFDMHGNIWQWCADWYDAKYYSNSPRQDPRGPAEGSLRVVRGGCWGSGGRSCRSAYRVRGVPGGRSGDLGVRLALVPPSGPG
jgi:formylglycine-generating enzyme required for sulfatase activity